MQHNTEVQQNEPVTIFSLPPELRTRIYHESGCLQYLEKKVGYAFRADYTAQDHRTVHGCVDGARCRYANSLPDFGQCKPAIMLTSGKKASQLSRYQVRCEIKSAYRDYPLPIKAHFASPVPPQLTQVSRLIRQETSPIFFANHIFVFELIGKDFDGQSEKTIRYLDLIGREGARLLKNVVIQYTAKKALHYINRKLLPEMRRRGLDGEYADVKIARLDALTGGGGWDVYRYFQNERAEEV